MFVLLTVLVVSDFLHAFLVLIVKQTVSKKYKFMKNLEKLFCYEFLSKKSFKRSHWFQYGFHQIMGPNVNAVTEFNNVIPKINQLEINNLESNWVSNAFNSITTIKYVVGFTLKISLLFSQNFHIQI